MSKYPKSLALGLIFSLVLITGCAEQSPFEADQPAFTEESTPLTTAARPTSSITAPVTGTITNTTTGVTENFSGTFNLTEFIVQDGQLFAVGTISGVAELAGQILQLPVNNIDGTCDILHLEIGPIDLDLLGLVVHIDQIVIDIDAESGPGNLLGNLLCGIAGLLDGGGTLDAIAQALNQLLGLLG